MIKKKLINNQFKISSRKTRYSFAFLLLIIVVIIFYSKSKFLQTNTLIINNNGGVTPSISETSSKSSNIYQIMSKEDYTNQAIQELSAKLNIDKSKIKVIKIVDQKWSDTSLGCPKKGIFYAQVVTTGYLITLTVDGMSFDYHAGLNSVLLCNK